MGEIAQRKIEEVVCDYYEVKCRMKKIELEQSLDDKISDAEIAKIQYIANIVGDVYLRDELIDMVNEIIDWKKYNNIYHEKN